MPTASEAGDFDLIEDAPAKINLALHVTGRRPDGYHLLDMLVTFADHGDRLGFAAAPEDAFSLAGRFADRVRRRRGRPHPISSTRARDAAARGGVLKRPIPPRRSISICKRTCRSPRASAADRRMRRRRCAASSALWRLTLPPGDARRNRARARRRRADVPCEPAADRPRDRRADRRLIAASTRACRGARQSASRASRRPRSSGARQPGQSRLRFETGAPRSRDEWLAVMRGTRNDLRAAGAGDLPARSPTLCALLEQQPGARLARMSGSGATCFGLFETLALPAKRAAALPAAARLVFRGDRRPCAGAG